MSATYVKCLLDGCDNDAQHSAFGRAGYCNKHYLRLRKHGDPDTVLQVPSPAKDWLAAHANHQDDACLTWPYHIGADGYGRIHSIRFGRLTTASRMMCLAAHGEPPTETHEAAHRCGNGNKACVNPRHLYWATCERNHADKIVHGTTNRGERQGRSRLTEEDVLDIRRLLGTISQVEIARRFGVHPSHISDIGRGKRWGWLP